MYIAIAKSVKSLEKKSKMHKLLPDEYPILCKEYDDMETAAKENPGCLVQTVAEYKAGQPGREQMFADAEAQAEKPWWKIW